MKLADLAYFMNERHRIYERRLAGLPPEEWTSDPIFKTFKFTNLFRELDHGTRVLRIAMNRAIAEEAPLEDVLFCAIFYRMFNWHEILTDVGWVANWEDLEGVVRSRVYDGKKVFTSCHMTTGRAGEDKHESYLEVLRPVWDERANLLSLLQDEPTLQNSFKILQRIDLVGPFVSYEIVSDLRWTPILGWHGVENGTEKSPPFGGPPDVLTWANPGPGARRGLRRLGRPETIDELVKVYHELIPLYEPHVKNHLPQSVYPASAGLWPPLELREIEHVCCEEDKRQRVLDGTGRPRERYRQENARELL